MVLKRAPIFTEPKLIDRLNERQQIEGGYGFETKEVIKFNVTLQHNLM